MTKFPRDTLWEMNTVNFLAYSLQWADLPGDFHRQRCLVGCYSWDHKELDMTEQLSVFTMGV